MARTYYVQKARKDYPSHGIKKGESYFWWKFRHGPKMYSKTPPEASQLTQSEFLGAMADIQDRIAGFSADDSTRDDLRDKASEIAQELRDLGSEQEDKLNNMPDSLQQGPTGEMLQSRTGACEEMADELENVDFHDQSIEDVVSELQAVEYQGE